MREIKFRGLRSDGKGWVYGWFVDGVIHEYNQAGGSLGANQDGSFSLGIDCWNIILETVGQFTGLKDRNGKDVYFSDVIKHPSGGLGVVVWMDDRLGIASGSINDYHAIDQIDYSEINQSEVVGNIHESHNNSQ